MPVTTTTITIATAPSSPANIVTFILETNSVIQILNTIIFSIFFIFIFLKKRTKNEEKKRKEITNKYTITRNMFTITHNNNTY